MVSNREIFQHSKVARPVIDSLEWVNEISRDSVLLKVISRANTRLRIGYSTSRIHRGLVGLGQVTRSSYLYRWLTSEPEPEVIVIDLRETYTAGPVIAAIDGIGAIVAPWYRHSRLARSIHLLDSQLTRLGDSRLGNMLKALFEPPEPPDEDTTTPEQNRE